MRTALTSLLLLLAVAVRAGPESSPNSVWSGTNSEYIVRMAIKPDGTNYGGARIIFHGQNPNGHPATAWRGDGWVTIDYGAGVKPDRIRQFQIVGRSPGVITGRMDNATQELFTLQRIR